jgi:plastocyanin
MNPTTLSPSFSRGSENRVRRLPATVLLLALAAGVAWPASGPAPTGTVEGIVRFTGKLPPPRRIITADGSIDRHDLIVEPKTRGLRDVVVALADAPARPKVSRRKPALMDQKDQQFVPRLLAVQHGRAVRFGNSDPFSHSVRASSSVKANDFNVFVAPGKPFDHVFEPQKHPVRIGCSLHAGMSAWVYVFAHPWFTLSGPKGTFQITKVPPGKYTLWLRHADGGLQAKRTITVRGGRSTRVEIEWTKVGE